MDVRPGDDPLPPGVEIAYELAKKAEKVYRFERGQTSTNFIQAVIGNPDTTVC